MGFFSNFRDAYNGVEGRGFAVGGKQLVCPHCGGIFFDESEAMLNTAGLTFLDLDWANRSAAIFICTQCGHIMWFLNDDIEELS